MEGTLPSLLFNVLFLIAFFVPILMYLMLNDGSGDWQEMNEAGAKIQAVTAADVQRIRAQTESGQEAHCLRHGDRIVGLRRRGMAYVCPECGVAYDMS